MVAKTVKKMAKKNKSPFGTSGPRFGIITVHPNLDPSGLYTVRDPGCDPCLYHPKPIHEIYQPKSTINPWQYKAYVEDWSKNLGYRNQTILKTRRWMASIGGPAWCQDYIPVPYEPACKNVSFGRAPRFRPSKNNLPGPGTYYSERPYKAPYGPHSTRPTLEREEPCRMKDTTPNWCLAPDRYIIIDKDNIDQKSNKLVSKLGPYQLLTGNRDSSTIKNHFSDSLKCSAATWPLALPGSFDKYKKSRFGTMNKTGRDTRYHGRNCLVDASMAYHAPSEPGPAHLNIDKPWQFVQNRQGFNSSYNKGPGYQRTVVWPAVARYNPHPISCGPVGHGHRHVFLGHDERTIGAILPQPFNSF